MYYSIVMDYLYFYIAEEEGHFCPGCCNVLHTDEFTWPNGKIVLSRCYECHKERRRQNYAKNKDRDKKKVKQWQKNNHQAVINHTNKYIKNRKERDPLFKLAANIRSRTRCTLKSKHFTKSDKFQNYIGCSLEELKIYIESQFQPGMTWDNWSYGGWHIDHIIPLSSAETEEEMYKLCHYTNLQPLWAKDNLVKSNKILVNE